MTVYEVARRLPDIAELRELCQSMAMLDAIFSPERESRYYTFTTNWAPGEQLASMNNGSGDEYSIVFCAAGVYIRGFDHESAMSPYGHDDYELWPGVIDSVPQVFAAQVAEPAFAHEGPEEPFPVMTACLWRTGDDGRWRTGTIDFPAGTADPDGANWMFQLLTDGTPQAYLRHAGDYYETSIDLDAVCHIYAHQPLTDDIVGRLNPEVTVTDLADDIAEIGYPSVV